MDMAKPSCTYCGTVLPHHARAAQQVAVVNQMMADRGASGMPRAFEGLLANAPHGQPHLIGVHAPPGAQVTPFGAQVTPFGAPPGIPAAYAQLHQQGMQVANTARLVAIVVSVAVFMMVLAGVVVGIFLTTAG
ncbi:MAG: hypothetical protein IPF92_14370 [Myxococcales bacterium]|jgi:hypothetical protein|nr:hypothetical protein [Myxococcales bacterium]